jgi:hypothetical protein
MRAPASNLTLTANGRTNYTVKLGEWTVEVYADDQIIDPSISDNNADTEFPSAYLAATVAAIAVATLMMLLKFRPKPHNETRCRQD